MPAHAAPSRAGRRRVDSVPESSPPIPGFDGIEAGDEGGARLSDSQDSEKGVNVIIKAAGSAPSLTLKELDAATTRKASKYILPWQGLADIARHVGVKQGLPQPDGSMV